MSSLSRILDLARDSESPVIIYDAYSDTDFILTRGDAQHDAAALGKECVCSSDDTYEREDTLLDDWYDFERTYLIEEMSSAELLDQINKDIAVWRAKEEQGRVAERADALTEELHDEPELAPLVEEGIMEPAWYPTSDILMERAASPFQFADMSLQEDRFTSPADFTHLQPSTRVTPLDWSDTDSVQTRAVQVPVDTPEPVVRTDITVQSLSEDPLLDEPIGESELLPDVDAPVFYQEPVV